MRSLISVIAAALLAGTASGQAVTVAPGEWITTTDNYLATTLRNGHVDELSHSTSLTECLVTPEDVAFDASKVGGMLLCTATVTADTPYELELQLLCDPNSDPMTGTATFTFDAARTRYAGRVRLRGESGMGSHQLDGAWFGQRIGACEAEAP